MSSDRFDGFPYLVTRVVPALYHVLLLPETQGEARAAELADRQMRINGLPTCLVLGHESALYFRADGPPRPDPTPPGGGVVITDRLQPCEPLPNSKELAARRGHLAKFIERTAPRRGHMFGDLAKGGRKPTLEERAMLEGRQPDGVPRGLEQCPACGEWGGRCLDPSPGVDGLVVDVHCRCDNDNRCAACLALLHPRRLNGNYFCQSAGRIRHVPGFSGLDHRCEDGMAFSSLGYLHELLGAWDIMYPGPDAMIREDHVEHLTLREDHSFTWEPAPAWTLPAGRWGVLKHADRTFSLGFETRTGGFRCHPVTLMKLGGEEDWAFHWQRSYAEVVIFADRILRGTRPRS